MTEWLTRSAFTQKARVRSRAQSQFFILLSKVIKIFAYPYFYAGNTMALLFFHENFWKNWKKILDLEIEQYYNYTSSPYLLLVVEQILQLFYYILNSKYSTKSSEKFQLKNLTI